MNLGQIRQEIADALSFDPTSSSYDESVIRRVNNVYRALCSSDPWDFLQKTIDYSVLPDFLGESGDPVLNWTGTFKTSIAPIFAADPNFNVFALEGATAIDPNGVGHRIGTVSVEAGGPYIRLWSQSAGPVAGPANIRFERWRLPADCVDVLGMVNREEQRGPLRSISEWEEHRHPLYNDQRSTPLAYVLENQTAQEYTGPQEYDPLNNAQLGTQLGQLQFVRPPDVRSTLLTPGATAGGNLVAGTTYEYMITWVSSGIETGPSQTLTVTLGPGDNSVAFANLPVINPPAGQPDFGANKVIYRRRQSIAANEPQGGWYRLLNGQDGTTTSALGLWSDAATTTDETLEQSLVQRYYEPVPARYVRFYPKPDREMKFSVRYHYLPTRLEEDRDIPAIPQEFHALLVHLVVEQIAAQADGSTLAAHHAKLSASLLDRMRRRYLTSRSIDARRRLWGTHNSFLIKPRIEFSGP